MVIKKKYFAKHPNLKDIILIWFGLPLKEKVIMILKQFYKGF